MITSILWLWLWLLLWLAIVVVAALLGAWVISSRMTSCVAD